MSGQHWDHDIHGVMVMVAPDGSMSTDPDCDCPADCADCDAEGVARDVAPAPVDWSARFRAAADVARAEGWPSHGNLFLALAGWMALDRPAVEAAGRALLGEVR